MALQTDITIEDFNLELKNAYIRLSEFNWKSGFHADIILDVWVDESAYALHRQPIKRLTYQMPIPLTEKEDQVTIAYNQVRILVYNWVKENYLTEAVEL